MRLLTFPVLIFLLSLKNLMNCFVDEGRVKEQIGSHLAASHGQSNTGVPHYLRPDPVSSTIIQNYLGKSLSSEGLSHPSLSVYLVKG